MYIFPAFKTIVWVNNSPLYLKKVEITEDEIRACYYCKNKADWDHFNDKIASTFNCKSYSSEEIEHFERNYKKLFSHLTDLLIDGKRNIPDYFPLYWDYDNDKMEIIFILDTTSPINEQIERTNEFYDDMHYMDNEYVEELEF